MTSIIRLRHLWILLAIFALIPAAAAQDTDGDGLTDAQELALAGGGPCPDLNNPDSDGDGINDGDEVNTELTDPCNWDTDGDGLSDDWEINGIPFTSISGLGNRRYMLSAFPTARRKNLYVEMDAMTGHNLGQVAAGSLPSWFLTAPVSNPDGSSGIDLTVIADDQSLPLAQWTSWAPPAVNWPTEHQPFKMTYYGTASERTDPDWFGPGSTSGPMREAKLKAYRYCVFADRLGTTSVSGLAEMQGNDMIVTLGGWGLFLTPVSWQTDAYRGTFLHEFGHNLGLGHGGPDNDSSTPVRPVNYKPNYHSIMNYSWQVPRLVGLQTIYTGLPTAGQVAYSGSWSPDFSSTAWPALPETALSEVTTSLCGGCVGPHAAHVAPVGPIGPWGYGYLEFESGTSIDFNRNGIPFESPVAVDLTNVVGACNIDECTGGPVLTCTQVDPCPLPGADDWSNIEYWGTGSNFASGTSGAELPPDGNEIDFETVRMLSFVGGCAFNDPFEYHTLGEGLHGKSGWKGWDDDPAFDAPVTDVQAKSEEQSLEISGTADLAHEFCAEGGRWSFSAWQYIPSTFVSGGGTSVDGSYFMLMNTYADGDPHDPFHYSVQMQFDSNDGLCKVWWDSANDTFSVPYDTDRWVKIQIVIDLEDDWTRIYYDDTLITQYEWTGGIIGSGGPGPGALDIAAVDLFGNGSSSIYYDELRLDPINPDCGGTLIDDIDLDLIDTLGETLQGTDPCNPDSDFDGILDGEDNCPTTENPGQEDRNGDGVGDACDTCPTDGDSSGEVDVLDLIELLALWGECLAPCPYDIDDNGFVDVLDLIAMLAAWGGCP